jgi:hypothetical protein
VPFESEEHYAACVTDLESFRQHLTEVFPKHPELFPAGISGGGVIQGREPGAILCIVHTRPGVVPDLHQRKGWIERADRSQRLAG